MLKVNKQKEQTPVSERDSSVRSHDFGEVAGGYTSEEAMNEAARCLQCPHAPCVGGCPVAVPVPQFIEKITEGDFAAAYALIRSTNIFPAITARVCAQEIQCEGVCVRGRTGEPVAIGHLQRFATDWAYAHPKEAERAFAEFMADASGEELGHESRGALDLAKKSVAIIGSGPASLACASELAKKGIKVTIFETLNKPGGIMTYGIPEFRLPKELAEKEIAAMESENITLKLDVAIGQHRNVEYLMSDEGFDAVFMGIGSGQAKHLGIEGEDLDGVYMANDLLKRINMLENRAALTRRMESYSGKKCVVVGGGNVAMDAARIIKRLGAEVTLLYRRGREQMPARAEEIRHAEEEDITFMTLTSPIKVLGDDGDKVVGLECVRMELGEPDESGRRSPVAVEGSSFCFAIDMLVVAAGSKVNPMLSNAAPGLKTKKDNLFVTDAASGETSLPGVFAGGDNVIGPATVVDAMESGIQAAQGIADYFLEQNLLGGL